MGGAEFELSAIDWGTLSIRQICSPKHASIKVWLSSRLQETEEVKKVTLCGEKTFIDFVFQETLGNKGLQPQLMIP